MAADLVEQRRQEQKLLLGDLAEIGVDVDSVKSLLSIPNTDERIKPMRLVTKAP